MVDAVLQTVSESVDAVNATNRETLEGVQVVAETQATLQEILAGVESNTERVTALRSLASTMVTDASSVHHSLDKVYQGSVTAENFGAQMAAGAEELAASAETLTDVVQRLSDVISKIGSTDKREARAA